MLKQNLHNFLFSVVTSETSKILSDSNINTKVMFTTKNFDFAITFVRCKFCTQKQLQQSSLVRLLQFGLKPILSDGWLSDDKNFYPSGTSPRSCFEGICFLHFFINLCNTLTTSDSKRSIALLMAL